MKQIHAFISGKVQGVWFRESTRREADRLGVVGWVRNTPDGRVEGMFQGPDDAVEALIAWCQQGPPDARVRSVKVQEMPVTEGLGGFQVLRGGAARP